MSDDESEEQIGSIPGKGVCALLRKIIALCAEHREGRQAAVEEEDSGVLADNDNGR